MGQGVQPVRTIVPKLAWIQTPALTIEEMRVIVEEAHKLNRKVAAHATTPEGIFNALTAGVDSYRAWALEAEQASAKLLCS